MESSLSQQQITELIEAAGAARRQAHAPYSHLRIGAALLGSDGRVYAGCNVENASYGLTICAERVAVGNAVAQGCREFLAIAVVGEGEGGLLTPCGACRQVLAEFNPFLTVICSDGKSQTSVLSLSELLPHRFVFNPPSR